MRIAIVGAGMAGLACATALSAAGHVVVLFDKGRGPGGRMSTRRLAGPDGPIAFDHGAQYFTARDAQFVRQVAAWEAAGIAARWPQAGSDAWVGVPGMNAPVKALADRHDIAWDTQIDALLCDASGWMLIGETQHGPFDSVVSAIPPEQAAPLLAPHDPAFAARASAATSLPCWTLMAAFAEPLPSQADTLRDHGPIGWAARNSAKPGRGGPEAWVVQANPDWSIAHLEEPSDAIAQALLSTLSDELGCALPAPLVTQAHRWRYARRRDPSQGPAALWNRSLGLGACGDWLLAPRVESAWLSGSALAASIAARRPAE